MHRLPNARAASLEIVRFLGKIGSLAILGLCLVESPLAAQPIDSQRVQKAIDMAVRFLTVNQLPDGGWDVYRGYPGGVTGLVTLALLNSGLPPEHPKVSLGLDYLNRQELDKTYTVSLQTMAFCAANPNKYARVIERNTAWLIEQQLPNGGWGYGEDQGGTGDPSNSQFALLALHEAQRRALVYRRVNGARSLERPRVLVQCTECGWQFFVLGQR